MKLTEEYTEIVSVRWLDSCSIRGWTSRNDVDALDIDPIETIGFLIKETDEFIIVAPSISSDMVDAPICIPKFAITRRGTCLVGVTDEK